MKVKADDEPQKAMALVLICRRMKMPLALDCPQDLTGLAKIHKRICLGTKYKHRKFKTEHYCSHHNMFKFLVF